MTAAAEQDYVALARQIATSAHAGQTRWGGEPFISHPEAVAKAVRYLGPEFEAAAWLHDVEEDCPEVEIPWAEFPVQVRVAVILLTHPKDMTYLAYVLLLSANRIARAVKLADLAHNLSTSDPAAATHRGKGGKTMRDKWELAKYILENLA